MGGFRDQGVEMGRFRSMYGGRSWILIQLRPLDFVFCCEDCLKMCYMAEVILLIPNIK